MNNHSTTSRTYFPTHKLSLHQTNPQKNSVPTQALITTQCEKIMHYQAPPFNSIPNSVVILCIMQKTTWHYIGSMIMIYRPNIKCLSFSLSSTTIPSRPNGYLTWLFDAFNYINFIIFCILNMSNQAIWALFCVVKSEFSLPQDVNSNWKNYVYPN